MRFRLLGPVEVATTYGWISPGSKMLRGVLAILLLEACQQVSRDKIIDLLWDDPPQSANANIRTYMARLRTNLRYVDPSLARQPLMIPGGRSGGAYRLDVAPPDIDLIRFMYFSARGQRELSAGQSEAADNSLREAINLWRGLAGQDIAGSRDLLDHFAIINEEGLVARESLIETQMRLGATATLLPTIHQIIAQHPLRESAHHLLIRTLYLIGDPAAALSAFERIRFNLADHLGADPSPKLQQLYTAILDHDTNAIRRDFHFAITTVKS